MTIYYPPTQNAIQKTLDAQLLEGITASMTLNNVVGIANKPGVCVVDFVDTNNKETPTKREYIAFTGVSGNTLTGLTRNADGGGTDQDHSVGAIVQFPPDILQQKAIIDTFTVEHGQDGKHTSAVVTTLKATGAEITTGTEDAKIVTPKAIADAGLVKDTDGTLAANSDSKIPSQKAVKTYVDSGWIPSGETWTYVGADDPTYTFKIAGVDLTSKYSPGMRIKLTQTSVKYFIITAVAFSTDTTITVYGGTDYDLANATITLPFYSTQKAPQGFPLSPDKWTQIATINTTQIQSTTTDNTWYNVGSFTLSVPIGVWELTCSASVNSYKTSAASWNIYATVSTTNNSETDSYFTAHTISTWNVSLPYYRRKHITAISKTNYYLLEKHYTNDTGTAIRLIDGGSFISATCAYL